MAGRSNSGTDAVLQPLNEAAPSRSSNHGRIIDDLGVITTVPMDGIQQLNLSS